MAAHDLILTGVTARIANVPLNRPVVARVGAFDKWAFICLDAATSGGIVGRSYIAPYLVGQAPAIVHAISELARPLEGRAVAPAAMFEEGLRRISLVGKTGIALYALAALDMALWDAHAQAAGQPLAVHLGGTLEPVRSYNSSGLWLGPVEPLADETRALVAEGGFSGVKLRLGRADGRDDREAAETVIAAAGPDVTVMSDFNQGLGLSEALHRLRALDDVGLYWFEEPVAYHDLESAARIARDVRTPVMLGENFHGPGDLLAALRAGACDMVMPDAMRIGGVTGWLRAAAIAGAFGVQVSSHLFPEVSAHLMRVTPTAHWLEWTDWAEPILARPFAVENGNVMIPDVPGTGIEWNEKALRKYRA